MADDEQKAASWWSTIPGILTGIAALVTAIAGLLAALGQFGWSGDKAADKALEPSVVAGAATADNNKDSGPAVELKSGEAPARQLATPQKPMAEIILRDGTRNSVFAESFKHLQTGNVLQLSSGQSVKVTSLKRIDVTDVSQENDHVEVLLTTRDGQQVAGKMTSGLFPFSFAGTNRLGDVVFRLAKVESVIFPD
jgi:hypothetical protein